MLVQLFFFVCLEKDLRQSKPLPRAKHYLSFCFISYLKAISKSQYKRLILLRFVFLLKKVIKMTTFNGYQIDFFRCFLFFTLKSTKYIVHKLE